MCARATKPICLVGGIVFLFSLGVVSSPNAAFSLEAINKSFFDSVALEGYDPVSYFNGEPQEGDKAFQYEWKGAVWRFASLENLEQFRESPELYEPQFGGYCAYGVSQGVAVNIDPHSWKIVDGKLYLNLSNHAKKLWEKDLTENLKKAKANWPKLLNQG